MDTIIARLRAAFPPVPMPPEARARSRRRVEEAWRSYLALSASSSVSASPTSPQPASAPVCEKEPPAMTLNPLPSPDLASHEMYIGGCNACRKLILSLLEHQIATEQQRATLTAAQPLTAAQTAASWVSVQAAPVDGYGSCSGNGGCLCPEVE